MRTAEKAGRIFFTLIGILGVMLLLLPQIGISVDSIMSGSMEPVLRTGGIVFTDTKERRPEIGDIVTYQVGETRVTHRVIRKEHKGYVTKGDANNREDPTVVTADQIIGKVIFSLPCLGYAGISPVICASLGYAAVFVRQRTIFGILTVMILQEMFFLLIQWKGERSRKSAERIYEK